MGSGPARYRVHLCGSYPSRSLTPYDIEVGLERTQAVANESGLLAFLATRPAIGDDVYVWFHGTKIYSGTITAADLADLGP